MTDFYGTHSPGPGASYVLKSVVGASQPDGRHANAPAYSFAGSTRAPVEPGSSSPGPKYTVPSAIGAQPVGRVKRRVAGMGSKHSLISAPRYSMAASSREVRALIFMGQQYEASAPPNVPTPGPAANYHTAIGLGEREPETKRRTSPRVAFSKANRWAAHERELQRNSVPGPGAYG